MKNNLKIAGLLLMLITFSSVIKAQDGSKSNQTIASDAPSGYTYDFDTAVNMPIIERITAPTKSNSDVNVFLDQKDFPTPPSNKTIDSSYKNQLRAWMEKNPNLVSIHLNQEKTLLLNINLTQMKKIFILLFSVFAFANLNAQTQVAIGPQSASFTSMVRGYHFTAPVNFTICGIYVAPDMSTAAQNCAIVRFTAAAPTSIPGYNKCLYKFIPESELCT